MRTTLRSIVIAAMAAYFIGSIARADDAASSDDAAPNDGWESLFDGKTFGKWKPNENADSWKIEDGVILVKGPRSHLFYMGDEVFKNFEFKIDVKTEKGANSGIFFHTRFQETGWPQIGYESQVNNTQRDPVKTGSLYNTVKLFESKAEDDKWWTQHIVVDGKKIVVKIDGETVIDWTEPEGKEQPKLSQGSFALQSHDPDSVIRYKNIYVKRLP